MFAVLPAVEPVTAACFSVHADADPGVLPRLLEIFAKRGMVPTRWISRRVGDSLEVDVQMEALAAVDAELFAAQMRALPPVQLVLTSQKG